MKNPAPYVSFVIAARNDNYGGHFLERISVFFTTLLYSVKKYSLDCEIIVVEWNPPPDRPHLHQELKKILNNITVRIHFTEVSNSIHQQFPNSSKMPIFEYIAKNVGVRRARGDYILVTNPDVLFSEELIRYLSNKKLDTRSFYRVDRFDVNQLIPLDLSVEKEIAFAQNHSFLLHALTYSVPLLPLLPFILRSFLGYIQAFTKRFATRDQNLFESFIHTNAAGDFLLMHKSIWFRLRGFPELTTHSFIDCYMCCIAYSAGINQKILQFPQVIFHVDHDRLTSDRPSITYEQVKRDCQKMLADKKPIIFNRSNWGLENIELKEHVFGRE